MLTLTETIDAIRSLDTDLDIITQACDKVLRPNAAAKPTPFDVAREIHATYYKKLDTGELIEALCIVLGTHGAMSAKLRHEDELLDAIKAMVTTAYNSSR